jgi:hypothetical protein
MGGWDGSSPRVTFWNEIMEKKYYTRVVVGFH